MSEQVLQISIRGPEADAGGFQRASGAGAPADGFKIRRQYSQRAEHFDHIDLAAAFVVAERILREH